MSINIKTLHHSKLKEAMDLVWQTFLKFEAPEYSKEGIQTFYDFIQNESELEKLDIFEASENGKILGILAVQGNHIGLFFVKEEAQNQGIGRALWEYFISQNQDEEITVHSSPYAVSIYKRLGFEMMDEEQLTDGIRYTPMRFQKNK